MTTKELRRVADEKWQAFFRASSATGIWLLAFVATLVVAAVGKESGMPGLPTIFVILLGITFSMSGILGIALF